MRLHRVTFLFAAAILAAGSSVASAQRLPTTVVPDHYDLRFTVDLERARYEGVETIRIRADQPTRTLVLNALDHKLPTASRTLDQTVERIDNCSEIRARQAPVLEKYFAAQTAIPARNR